MLMKKLLLTFAVLLGFALPGLADNLVLDFTSNPGDWMPSGSNSKEVTKTSPEGVDVTFSKNAYFNTSKYLMVKTNASIVIKPNIQFKEIKVSNSSNCSTSTKVTIKTGSDTYGSATTFSTRNSTYSFANKDVVLAETAVTFEVSSANCQITKIEFVEAETGPKDFEPAFKDKAYSIFKGETLDVNSLITVNTPPLSHLRAS